MQTIPTAPSSELSEPAHCCTVFVPDDPARTGRVAFWRPVGAPPPGAADPGAFHGSPMVELDIVLPTTDGVVEPVRAPALLLPAHHALPLLLRPLVESGGRGPGHPGPDGDPATALAAARLGAESEELDGL